MSLKSISFSSYKKFKGEERVEIKPVTVLVGKNSSGKSSICKLFPMLANSMMPYNIFPPLLFENNGVSLGTSFSDISHNGDSVGLSFGLQFSSGIDIKVNLVSEDLNQSVMIERYELNKNNENFILIFDRKNRKYTSNFQRESFEIIDFSGFYHEGLFEKAGVSDNDIDINVDYIGPFRILPQRVYHSKGFEVTGRVGVLGENAYHELYTNLDLKEQVSKWYVDNFGVALSVDWVEGLKGALQVHTVNELNGNIVNIVDEGQGMNQALPIVVRCNMAEENSIVVVEQPELHLHPKAHASLGRLFAETSKNNSQNYIVETHSENLLLGLRDAVVDSDIDFNPDDVVIYFVDEDDEDGSAYLRPITIQEDGMLSDWPTGVFNEAYELLSEIKRKAFSNKNR